MTKLSLNWFYNKNIQGAALSWFYNYAVEKKTQVDI